MIHKAFVKTEAGHIARITFSLPESFWADSIYLVGDFNDWSHDAHPLRRDHDGGWTITLDLEADREYEFRYLCDGEWLNDNQADSYRSNVHGTHNSVVSTANPDEE